MPEQKTPAIDRVEHDGTFGVKKVSPFLDNGAGGLVRASGDTSGNQNVNVVSGVFTPSGTQDVNLTKVGGTAFALGQQLDATSVPVVLTAAQLATLTPLATVPVTQSTSPWVVSGTVTADTELPAASVLADAGSATPTVPQIGAIHLLMNATTLDRQRAVVNALNSVGTGIAAAGLVAQLDDTAVGSVTENQFAPVRMTSLRGLHVNLRTNAGADIFGSAFPAFAATADGNVNPTVTAISTFGSLFNNSTWDRIRSIINATNSIGTGIQAVGIVAQFDDTAPTSITENQFGNLRMSANRNQYVTIRDAAGNERGLNIDASGQLAITVASIPSHAVTNAGTFAVQDATAQASLSVLDDWDESDRAKVNPIVGQAGVQGGAGAVSALTQRIAIATDANVVSTKTDLTPSSPTAASVGTSSAQAVASASTRKGLVLTNTSSAVISIAFGATAVLYSGITLFPYGTFQMDEHTFDTGAVNAIASIAASNLAIQEFLV